MTRIATITNLVEFLTTGTDNHGFELFDPEGGEEPGPVTELIELHQSPAGDLWYVGPVGLRERAMTASEGMHSVMLTVCPPRPLQVTILDATGAPVAAYAAA